MSTTPPVTDTYPPPLVSQLSGVRRNLLVLQPALRTLTQDYNSLKRQVRDFPGLISQAMKEARDEVSSQV